MSAAVHTMPVPPLTCTDVDVEVAGRVLVHRLTMSLPKGSITSVLGCNGAGKTLTLHTLAGLRAPSAGTICVGGRDLSTWHRKELARELGLLAQTTEDPFPSTVLDAVLVGRHPHIGFWRWESERDKEIAREALALVGLSELEERELGTLSGGERRRVAIATLLAQDPNILILDEPLNHLDPHHQLSVLQLLRKRAAEGRTIVMSLHDVGLAARFTDRALLLFGNGEWQDGATTDVLNEASISRLYGTRA
ncbi:MAG TPA: ABC transporter ATP-binding protein, partial [Steroidobacteraceae bacterium]